MPAVTERHRRADPRKKSRRWLWLWIVTAGLGIVFLSFLTIVLLWMSEPWYWTQEQHHRQSTQLKDRQLLGTEVEKRLLARLSYTGTGEAPPPESAAPRPGSAAVPPDHLDDGDERSLSITLTEANAWLETRLPEWLANQGAALPQGVSDPMVAVENGRLILAFRYQTPRLSQVFSLVFRPELVPADSADPQLKMNLEGIRGGRLPLPTHSLLQAIAEKGNGPASPALQSWAAMVDGRSLDPVMPVPGDPQRAARLLGLKIEADHVDLALRLEPRHKH